MLLKKLIVLINIMCYIIVVHSVDTYEYETEYSLEQLYWIEIVNNDKNTDDKYFICQSDNESHNKRISLAATICKTTLDKLRNMMKNYKGELYVDYNSFDLESGSLCINNHVTLHEMKIPQKMINCHNISALTDRSKFYNEIKIKVYIYPTNQSYTSWLVINCRNRISGPICTLNNWFKTNKLMDLVPITLFGLATPRFLHTEESIYIHLLGFIKKWDHLINKSGTHVLHKVDFRSFKILCRKITGEKGQQMSIEKPGLNQSILIFPVPKTNGQYLQLNGLFYSCDNFIVKNGFSLFIGPGDSSMILASRESGHTYYRILKIVTDIYIEHLPYVF